MLPTPDMLSRDVVKASIRYGRPQCNPIPVLEGLKITPLLHPSLTPLSYTPRTGTITQCVKTAEAMAQGLSRAMGKLGRDALRAAEGLS